MPELTTLNLANNRIKSMENFERLVDCRTLSVLDLSHNRIDDILIVGVLGKMPELRVLVMTGNPVINMIPMYRKTLINECVSSFNAIKSLIKLNTVVVTETTNVSG